MPISAQHPRSNFYTRAVRIWSISDALPFFKVLGCVMISWIKNCIIVIAVMWVFTPSKHLQNYRTTGGGGGNYKYTRRQNPGDHSRHEWEPQGIRISIIQWAYLDILEVTNLPPIINDTAQVKHDWGIWILGHFYWYLCRFTTIVRRK